MIFYAPNVHVGGGFELLKSLLESIQQDTENVFVLDARISERVNLSQLKNIHFVEPTIASRFNAELLVKKISRNHNKVFCFHGLPPIIATSNNISVFVQNRLYINKFSLVGYGLKTSLRLTCERFIFKRFSPKVTEYIVQSNSMKEELLAWFGRENKPMVSVFPFLPVTSVGLTKQETLNKYYDFIYVADASEHKNHHNLLQAWKKLALNGHFPSLALTLHANSKLIAIIDELNESYGCSIINLGFVSRQKISEAYIHSRALIYPSLVESFGMPLIEAQQFGLPIIASELDYVRDVVKPIQTFNPHSNTSIYLSVLRFLDKDPELVKIEKPKDFIDYLI